MESLGAMSIVCPRLIRLFGKAIPEATDRQVKILGFDQGRFSMKRVLMFDAGGLGSHNAPTFIRKGIGKLILLHHDTVAPNKSEPAAVLLV